MSVTQWVCISIIAAVFAGLLYVAYRAGNLLDVLKFLGGMVLILGVLVGASFLISGAFGVLG